MRVTSGPSVGLLGLLLLLTPVIAQNNRPSDLPDLATVTTEAPATEDAATTAPPARTTDREPEEEENTSAAATERESSDTGRPSPSLSSFRVTNAPAASETSTSETTLGDEETESVTGRPSRTRSVFHLTGLPTIAGVGIPKVGVPDTHAAPFMQKSNLPDGTVFICVGAALGAFGAAVLIWRALVAWALHRSVKRAAMAQNLADLKAMSAAPVKKRGFYSTVGASSNMSLDRLSAAPTGTSKPPVKPFSSGGVAGTPPKHMSTSSLFFSPTAGAVQSARDTGSRSSSYLPAGYYPTAAAQTPPMTHVGGHHAAHSSLSLSAPANRFSTRSGISPPASPSLPPSRGPGGSYDRAPPSRGNDSVYRSSVAGGGGVYGAGGVPSQSSLSLNVPGGTHVAGGRAPSAYLEDLFDGHGGGGGGRL